MFVSTNVLVRDLWTHLVRQVVAEPGASASLVGTSYSIISSDIAFCRSYVSLGYKVR